ncbi:MAG: putative lipid II flippase FtsW [Verrucomicrobia bacterium]|nr:putative lipid II flippase FtsW [Verrucomicrobiota bacterium]
MKGPALLLLLTVSLIVAIGVVMVFNTSAAEVLDRSLKISTHHALIKQLLYLLLGVLLALAIHFIGYESLLRTSFPLLCFLTLLLLLCFVPGIGQQRNGAHRWIGIGAQTVQPSEFVKIWLPLFVIHFISLKQAIDFRKFLQLCAFCAVPLFLILVEPDNGTTFIILLTLLTLFLIARVPTKFWLLPLLLAVVCAGVAASQVPYVKRRIEVYLHPERDLHGRGHQPYQAKIAAGSGGLWGRGVGKSMQKLTYLPEAQNDYIAAIYAEETGFVGTLALIFLYMLFAAAGFTIAVRAKNQEAFCLAIVLTTLISLQAFLNLGVVSGLAPAKGLNLPFFSQGGSSLWANTIALSLLLSISREKERLSKGLSKPYS